MSRRSILPRFWRFVEKRGENECWFWKGATQHSGHGQFSVDWKMVPAHRVAYELLIGPIPEGMFVLHSCDVPGCVNPKHLRIGTQRDNIKDASAKHRLATGTRHGSYKHGFYCKK